MMNKTILEIKDIHYRTKNKKILNGVNLKVRRNEVLSIIGVNGTGKTTLASILTGINKPKKGKLIFEGKDITNFSMTKRARLGVTLAWQMPAVFDGISVRDYVSLGGKIKPEKCLKLVGLNPDPYLDRMVDGSLSGGERKRIELASVISMNPKLTILDEPDSGIDMASIDVIKKAIKTLKKMKTSVILITHSEEMARIGDRAALLCNGKIVKKGDVRDITKFFKKHCKKCGHVGEIVEEILK